MNNTPIRGRLPVTTTDEMDKVRRLNVNEELMRPERRIPIERPVVDDMNQASVPPLERRTLPVPAPTTGQQAYTPPGAFMTGPLNSLGQLFQNRAARPLNENQLARLQTADSPFAQFVQQYGGYGENPALQRLVLMSARQNPWAKMAGNTALPFFQQAQGMYNSGMANFNDALINAVKTGQWSYKPTFPAMAPGMMMRGVIDPNRDKNLADGALADLIAKYAAAQQGTGG